MFIFFMIHFSLINSNTSVVMSNNKSEFNKTDTKIIISGNSELAASASSGNGSAINPYIIENKVIDGGGSGSCIYIENTDNYFIIRNCLTFNSGSNFYNSGICLRNVKNGELFNNTAWDCHEGICVYFNSADNIIINNTVYNNCYGIYISGYDNQINNNTAFDNYIGIQGSYRSILRNNYLYNNRDYGIYLLGDNAILTGNHFELCYLDFCLFLYELVTITITPNNTVNGKSIGYYTNLFNITLITACEQLILVNCSKITIKNLNLSGGWFGLWLINSNNNSIQGNNLSYNRERGISISNSYNNTFVDNIVSNSNRGFFLGGNYNIIDQNTIINNTNGIYLYGANGNIIRNNKFNFNYYGIYTFDSIQNLIFNNTYKNNRIGIELDSGPGIDISEFNYIYNNTASYNYEAIC